MLREKGETYRWQPVSPTLMAALAKHTEDRNAPSDGGLLRYRDGRPITDRRYDYLWHRLGRAPAVGKDPAGQHPLDTAHCPRLVVVSRLAPEARASCGFRAAAGRVVFLWLRLMILSFFSSQGWESWDVEHRPLIPERMPVLVDDDLLFEDGPGRPAAVGGGEPVAAGAAGQRGAGAEARGSTTRGWSGSGWSSWPSMASGLFDSRGPAEAGAGASTPSTGRRARWRQRFAATTWAQHMSILSLFYRWAIERGSRRGGAVHLPDRAGAVRRHGPRGEGEPGGTPDPEAARDDQVPGARLHRAVPGRTAGPGGR